MDLYSPIATYQPIVFAAQGLDDTKHVLTITATGRRNAAAVGARVVVDAFDVYTPGRRYEEYHPSIVTRDAALLRRDRKSPHKVRVQGW